MCIVALLDETDFNVIYLDVKIYHDANFFLKKMGIILFLTSYKKNSLKRHLPQMSRHSLYIFSVLMSLSISHLLDAHCGCSV